MRRTLSFNVRILIVATAASLFAVHAHAASKGNTAVQQKKGPTVSRMGQGECLDKTLGKLEDNSNCASGMSCSWFENGAFHRICVDTLKVPAPK